MDKDTPEQDDVDRHGLRRGKGPLDGAARVVELLPRPSSNHAGGPCPDSCSAGDNCDIGCDPGCNLIGLFLPRLSTLLLVTAALAPSRCSHRPVKALIGFYRRYLSRWTPSCPATPSCGAYALDAIDRLGTRDGLIAAATRIRGCA